MKIVNTIGDGRTEIDLRGLDSKETLVLQDGRRLATDGFAGYEIGLNFFFSRYSGPQPVSTWAD